MNKTTLFAIIVSVPIMASTIPPFQNHTIQSFIERHPNGTLTVAGPPMERCTYSSGGITCDESWTSGNETAQLFQHPNETITTQSSPMEECNISIYGTACDE